MMYLTTNIKSVRFHKAYTLEALLKIMQHHSFEAGIPSIAMNGTERIIVFPAINSQNQIQITPIGFGPTYRNITIQTNKPVPSMHKIHDILHDAFSSTLWSNEDLNDSTKRHCDKLVDETAKTIESLNL